MLSLSVDVTEWISKGLKKSSQNLITHKEALSKNLDKLIAEGKIKPAIKTKILNEIASIAEIKTNNILFDDFLKLRSQYFNTTKRTFNRLWKKSVKLKHLNKQKLLSLYTKHLDEFPGLAKGHNQAIFNIQYLDNGKVFSKIEEFSISGRRREVIRNFGNPPILPSNTVDVFSDSDTYLKFITGAFDIVGRSRKYDSEIKFIYNFIKNHFNKADEFIIETSNIFKTCGSCSREFVILKQLAEQQGKKITIIINADDAIDGFEDLINIIQK